MRLAPVSAWRAATSSTFSSVVRGSPPRGKRPNRVPPVPTAQEGAPIEQPGHLVDHGLGVDPRAGQPGPGVVEVGLVAGDEAGLGVDDRVGGDPHRHGSPSGQSGRACRPGRVALPSVVEGDGAVDRELPSRTSTWSRPAGVGTAPAAHVEVAERGLDRGDREPGLGGRHAQDALHQVAGRRRRPAVADGAAVPGLGERRGAALEGPRPVAALRRR